MKYHYVSDRNGVWWSTRTSIIISKELKQELHALKIHPRQTFEEVIRKLYEERTK